jgi:predicted RNase H-like HicB family nuclease
MAEKLQVDVMFDDEAHVYVATSKNIPGLATEAESIGELRAKLAGMIPELLELNGLPIPKSVGMHVREALALA